MTQSPDCHGLPEPSGHGFPLVVAVSDRCCPNGPEIRCGIRKRFRLIARSPTVRRGNDRPYVRPIKTGLTARLLAIWRWVGKRARTASVHRVIARSSRASGNRMQPAVQTEIVDYPLLAHRQMK
jgi:hypothetical protein